VTGAPADLATPLRARFRLPLPLDLSLTLSALRHGPSDPTMAVDPDGAWWRATRTPEGSAEIRVRQRSGEVLVEAWGPGAEWALAAAPELLGARDSLEGFDPPPGLVRDLHHLNPGLRITRSRAVFEALLPVIIEQRIAGAEARAIYRDLMRRWAEPAPGPKRLLVPPSPESLAALPYHELHPVGIEMRKAGVIRDAARRASRIEATADLSLADARRFMTALPGIGPWTAAEVALVALGDPDAVSVGDYHLPNIVAWALAGESRANDERMLELLEPFAGHRGRVLRLLAVSGIRAPRFGPRRALRSFRRI
jgi:3-methyladenine DNA glycosylase/8-oxoguanine DNA glycosylase